MDDQNRGSSSQSLVDKLQNSSFGSIAIVVVVTIAVIFGAYLIRGGGLGESGPSVDAQGNYSEVELEDASAKAPEVGEQAPGFRALDLDGLPVTLDSVSDKPVWLIFNATWCTECRTEVPEVKRIAEEYGDEITIISVYVNDSTDSVVAYSEQLGLDYTQIVDGNSEIASAYRTMGIPAHYFIAPGGDIDSIAIGGLGYNSIVERLAGLGL